MYLEDAFRDLAISARNLSLFAAIKWHAVPRCLIQVFHSTISVRDEAPGDDELLVTGVIDANHCSLLLF